MKHLQKYIVVLIMALFFVCVAKPNLARNFSSADIDNAIATTPLIARQSVRVCMQELMNNGITETNAAIACSGQRNTKSVLKADSVTQFSLVQGKNNWYYGYYQEPSLRHQFRRMTEIHRDAGGTTWWWVERGKYWTFLLAMGGHPNSPTTSGGRTPVNQWAVRRWVSNVNGEIEITGRLAKGDTAGGDGITGYILVNGEIIWSQYIAPTDGTGVNYTVNTMVKRGSVIDFAIAPNANSYNDSTTFTATIRS